MRIILCAMCFLFVVWNDGEVLKTFLDTFSVCLYLISMSSSLASALFCGSGLAVLLRQRLLRDIEGKPTLKKVLPPVAKKVNFQQYFGKHPDRPEEYRGDDVMDPPKSHSDDYQWLRDDSRTNEEVNTIQYNIYYTDCQIDMFITTHNTFFSLLFSVPILFLLQHFRFSLISKLRMLTLNVK